MARLGLALPVSPLPSAFGSSRLTGALRPHPSVQGKRLLRLRIEIDSRIFLSPFTGSQSSFTVSYVSFWGRKQEEQGCCVTIAPLPRYRCIRVSRCLKHAAVSLCVWQDRKSIAISLDPHLGKEESSESAEDEKRVGHYFPFSFVVRLHPLLHLGSGTRAEANADSRGR